MLAALWAAGEPVAAGTVREQLHGDPAYTTVLTILTRLHDKGLVTRERAGRAYLYAAVRDEAAHTAAGMRALLDQGSDRAAVLAQFVSNWRQKTSSCWSSSCTDTRRIDVCGSTCTYRCC